MEPKIASASRVFIHPCRTCFSRIKQSNTDNRWVLLRDSFMAREVIKEEICVWMRTLKGLDIDVWTD
jgi:hypothetical protein